MANLEFLATDANDQGNLPRWEIVSAFFWCDFEKYIFLYIFYILLLVQTFLFRFKFEGEKLITLGVGLYQNEDENFLNRIVKSELNKNVQGRHRNSARNSSFSSNS